MYSQNDIHSATSFGRRIVRGGLLPDEVDGFANTGIAKFDSRNNDAIELVADTRSITGFALDPTFDPSGLSVLTDRLFPAMLDLPHGAAASFIVGFDAILVFGQINSLLPLTRRGVVGIEIQHLVVAFHRQIVAARLIKPLRFRQQLFHLLDFGEKLWPHRFVDVTGIVQMS